MESLETWMRTTLASVRDLTPTIRLFELQPPARRPAWSPGAHVRVRVAIDGRPAVRRYSLIDDGSDDGRLRIAVKLAENGLGGSRAMWALRPGEGVDISAPENHFELGLAAPSYTLVAGGVGITPLLGMARCLARTRRPVRFHYSVRNREEAAFAELLRTWLGEGFRLHAEDESGRLDFAQIIEPIPAQGELYLCGPIGMLEAARAAWQAGGRPASLLRYESFASSGHYANQSFTAVLPRFGRELQVPAHQTLLSALEEAGIEVLADCRRGECGLCAVDILACDAPVDHRDVFFSDDEKAGNRKLCACVSRPAGGRIEIDTAYRGPVPA
ncbi:MAG: PDR/VanB family oxidoreductase [Rhodocyclaceae bacterium]|jgi:vanillate O-demethylase ferredoxin subunit|nr:Carnitine monooxygenase reductase subunit [Rhodocyclaceae bacterium]MCL4680606.1 PDR/VanB family oxidoreductase [Rhodocyclaceae bacterium]